MKYFLSLLLLATISCYSQDKSIIIQLKSDSLITTKWIKLYDFPFSQKAYIRIQSELGYKINLSDINYYKGYDQDDNFRYFKTVNLEIHKSFRFSERLLKLDSTQSVTIYYDYITMGGTDILFPSKFENNYYSIKNQPIKKVSYSNIRNDLARCEFSQSDIKSANGIRFLQLLSAGIGTVLITKSLWNIANPLNENFPKKVSEISIIAGGVFFIIPFTLESLKKKFLIDALRKYQ
jgi:hypothetical protein